MKFCNLNINLTNKEELFELDKNKTKCIVTLNAQIICLSNTLEDLYKFVNENYATIDGQVPLKVARIKNKKNLPQFTSCCPSWIKYCEMFHDDLLDNISTTKSPIMIQGALINSYYSEFNNLDKNKIINVMVAPCVDKKYEIKRHEHTNIDYVKDYGYVIEPVLFKSEDIAEGVVFDNQHYTIGTTASESATRINYMKYSVFFWLEGNDPECDEDIMGGTIKFDLTVSVSM